MDLNDIIPYEITVYDSNFNIINTLSAYEEEDRPFLNRDLKRKLASVIDKIGIASAQSQGLKDVITTSQKLSLNDNHRVYLMKDESGVVGLLKVGKKRLFVYDQQGNQHELCPLCVLDFFTTQQRRGHGRRLFDFMLKNEKIQVKHLAIDQPSEKSLRFLSKHYGLTSPIPQNNKFVVYPGFFDNREDKSRGGRNKLESYSASGNMYSGSGSKNTFSAFSESDFRRQKQPFVRADSMNDKLYAASSSSATVVKNNGHYGNTNNEDYLNQHNRILNPHLITKQYSAPNLEKIPFPSTIQTTTNQTTNLRSYNSPAPPTPIENHHYQHTSPMIPHQPPQTINYNNYYNRNDPFPSLSSKPPIYGQPSRLPPVNIQNTFNQINKYSAFPSLGSASAPHITTTNYNNNNNKPYDAFFLDKFRKTKLW